jgi:hypothetical protein
VLSDDGNLKQTVSHVFLFCLADYGGGGVSPVERFQIGVEAIRRWQLHCKENFRNRNSVVACFNAPYSNSEDELALLGLFGVVALAIFIDRQNLMAAGTVGVTTLETVANLVFVFSEDWIDPICAVALLLEVCRLFHAQFNDLTVMIEDSRCDKWDYSYLKETLRMQENFFQGPNGITALRQMSDTLECILHLAQKCKTTLAAFITQCKYIANSNNADYYQFDKSEEVELPSREICLRDFLSLEHMCQAFPDSGFDFESLLQVPAKQSSQTRHSYRYYGVVEELKRYRRRANDQPEEEYERGEGAEYVYQFLALQHLLQARQRSFELPFFWGGNDSDDSDDY